MATSILSTVPSFTIGNFINSIKSRGETDTALALQTLQDSSTALVKTLAGTSFPVTPTPTTSGSVTYANVALTTGSTTIVVASPATQGVLLVIFITQDSTGGRQIAWDTNFKFTTVNIETDASTVSVFTFISRTDPSSGTIKWFMTGIPLTGQS